MNVSTPGHSGHPQPVGIISPFLKWAGAKTRSMNVLLSCLPSPQAVDCLIEPFAGSTSVFLNTRYRQYVLADSNADLVDTWRHARDTPEELINRLHRLYAGGNCQMAWQRNRLAFNTMPPGPEKSALFIYLNRHGFNGLCRYNQKGQFNVPFGRPAQPYLPAREIRTFARKAARCHVSFFHAGFEETLEAATRGMFAGLRCAIYCDPPYLALSDSASFTTYDGTAFTAEHHRKLATRLRDIHRMTGFPVVVSASDTPASRLIYRDFTLNSLSVNRSVSAAGTGRKAVGELAGCLP
ncbi:DNA adenine methylase [Citrobacter meridianamericanus]|uniref:DNA adenine methylase n=1 Tax=Citrobacter meridianamericanus TaxID=2894201 RepID=UPI00351CE765